MSQSFATLDGLMEPIEALCRLYGYNIEITELRARGLNDYIFECNLLRARKPTVSRSGIFVWGGEHWCLHLGASHQVFYIDLMGRYTIVDIHDVEVVSQRNDPEFDFSDSDVEGQP